MSTKLRVQVLQACDAYLSSTTWHPHGFCAWAACHLALSWRDPCVHALVDTCRREMAGIDKDAALSLYVGNDTGRTPERTQFVQDLRDYLLLDI